MSYLVVGQERPIGRLPPSGLLPKLRWGQPSVLPDAILVCAHRVIRAGPAEWGLSHCCFGDPAELEELTLPHQWRNGGRGDRVGDARTSFRHGDQVARHDGARARAAGGLFEVLPKAS